MATSVIFGNKICKLPGSYARVVSGIVRETPLANYSNFLLVDIGAGNGFNSLKGIKGNGKECVYALDEEQANYFIKGGPLEPLITALYNPAPNRPGIGTLYVMKVATTTPASASVAALFGGKITFTSIKTVEEGAICNTYPTGITSETALKKGFVLKCVFNASLGKGYVEIYEGSYRGTNYKGYVVGDTEENSTPVLVYRSKKCSTPAELVNYLKNPNSGFGDYFEVEGLTTSESSFGSADISEVVKFSGGSDIYASTPAELSEALGNTLDSDYSCMFVAEANGTTNLLAATMNHVLNDAKGIKQVITVKAEKEDALLVSAEQDSDQLIVA